MDKHYLLAEVSKLVGRKPHQIIYLLTSGKIPEPEQRIGNRRLFSAEDVIRLARHFKVTPKWDVIEPAPADADAETPRTTDAATTVRGDISVGETGHEIKDGDGEVFAWAADRGKALVLAGLLEAAARG